MSERIKLLLLGLAVLAGCNTEEPGSDPGGTLCRGACDGFENAPPALEPVDLSELGQCWAKLDETTSDPFFQVHRIECELRVPSGLVVDRIYTNLRTGDDDHRGGVFEGEELRDELLLARFREEDLPITVSITIPMDFEGSDARTVYWGFETTVADLDTLAALTEEAPLSVGPPITLWPIVLWPDAELAAGWGNDIGGLYELTDYGFPITSAELAVGGPAPAEEVRYRRSDVVRPREIAAREIGSLIRMMPVPIEGFGVEPSVVAPPSLRATTFVGDASERVIELTGPGYYLVAPDGSAELVAPTDLPRFAEEEVPDADAGATNDADAGAPDGGSTPADDAAVADGGDPDASDASDASPTVDPCMGACTFEEACVGGACIARAAQSQSSTCSTPTASCDPGEDFDCAAGHACAGGTCRRLRCQRQDALCNPARSTCEEDTDCDVGHACAGGVCRRLSCQSQDSLCNTSRAVCETSTDCAAGHACVDGTCRRLSCQTQDRLCNTPRAGCALDTDCDSDHVCVDGACRRLSCQSQDRLCNRPRSSCAEDADCAADHVCAASACRRLSCQSQDRLCNTARAPCETTSDCGDDHVCEGALCRRIRCL